MKTIILININEDPRKLISKLTELISSFKVEYSLKSEKSETYLKDLLVRLRRIKKNNGIFVTNKDLSLERNISGINQFKNQNNIKITILK
jgi:hypothetical protein